MSDHRTGSVRSADGTTIGYRTYGSPAAPALILLHGGMKAAQHLADLAAELGLQFAVHVPDRRGRGMSGPHGEAYCMAREVEDARALIDATSARLLFGHSAGGLVALRTALVTPDVERLAVYEPPLSIHGSAPTDWLPRFDREIERGRRTAATVTALKGMGTEPLFSSFPRWVLTGVGSVALRAERPGEGEASIRELVPTIHYDIELVREMDGTAEDYAALAKSVLLLGGTKCPDYLELALHTLAATLPNAERITLDGLDHQGPEEDGSPAVAAALRAFFAS